MAFLARRFGWVFVPALIEQAERRSAGLALMVTGGTVAVLSGGPPLGRALRQLAIGAAAAAGTCLLGHAVNAVID